MLIHRFSMNGKTVCGAPGKCSNTGANVTCPECLRLVTPATKREAFEQIRAAAESRRAKEQQNG